MCLSNSTCVTCFDMAGILSSMNSAETAPNYGSCSLGHQTAAVHRSLSARLLKRPLWLPSPTTNRSSLYSLN